VSLPGKDQSRSSALNLPDYNGEPGPTASHLDAKTDWKVTALEFLRIARVRERAEATGTMRPMIHFGIARQHYIMAKASAKPPGEKVLNGRRMIRCVRLKSRL
jgi:hypothetical protein